MLVGSFGVAPTMTWMGIIMLVAVPALYRVPGFTEFFRRSPAQLTDHFLKTYPQVFGRGVGAVLSYSYSLASRLYMYCPSERCAWVVGCTTSQ